MEIDNIVLFGSTGMLGNYCLNVLQRSYNVIAVTRRDYDIMDNDYDKLFNIISSYKNSVIVNCAGSIPQRGIGNEMDCFITNSLFPKMLDKIACQLGLKFVHVSTNCVFNYPDGNCNELAMPNETQSYGLSKILGEPDNASVIRTSIIGEEIANKKSLLEWVISNKGGKVNGYTNYLWNGCSCLELAKFIKTVIDTDTYWKGVKHIHSMETVSKHELLCMINEIYDLDISITPCSTGYVIDKTLSSIHDDTVITVPIKEQIMEQKNIGLKSGACHTMAK